MEEEFLIRIAKKSRKKFSVNGDVIEFLDGNTLTLEDLKKYEKEYEKKFPKYFENRYGMQNYLKKGDPTFLQYCLAESQKKFSENSIRKVTFVENANNSDLCMLGISKKLLEKIGITKENPYVSLEYKNGRIEIRKSQKKSLKNSQKNFRKKF